MCLLWLRRSLMLTQYQIASYTEIDYRHYQSIESGKVDPKIGTLRRLCSGFGLSLTAFFYILSQKPWETDQSAPGRPNGELYLHCLVFEQSQFRLDSSVRSFLTWWGRSMADGDKQDLAACPKPVLEVDRDLNVLWKNKRAGLILGDSAHELAQILEESFAQSVSKALTNFWSHPASEEHRSFYLESRLSSGQMVAVVALKPLVNRGDTLLMLGLVDISKGESSESVMTLA